MRHRSSGPEFRHYTVWNRNISGCIGFPSRDLTSAGKVRAAVVILRAAISVYLEAVKYFEKVAELVQGELSMPSGGLVFKRNGFVYEMKQEQLL